MFYVLCIIAAVVFAIWFAVTGCRCASLNIRMMATVDALLMSLLFVKDVMSSQVTSGIPWPLKAVSAVGFFGAVVAGLYIMMALIYNGISGNIEKKHRKKRKRRRG